MDLGEKYGAGLFDPADPRDARAEAARKTTLCAFIAATSQIETGSGDDLQDIAGGMLVGLISVMAAHMVKNDQNYASLRVGLMQLIPWAVDMARSIENLPPLSDN